MRRIIVLGATGHLGAYTSLFLSELGYQVIAVGRRLSDNDFFLTKSIQYIGGFSLENCHCYHALPTDIDAVVHLAGTMPAHADATPMPYVNSIIVGMVNLCEWVKSTECRRIIFNTTPSDVSKYFGTDIPVKDDVPRSFPKDGGDHAVYAIAKNAAVDILEHYAYAHGISSCIFRHLTVYGYQPNPYYFLNGIKKMLPWRFIQEQAMKGNIIEVWGDATRKKELLYVKDFTLAIACALKTDAKGIFNLSGDRPYTLDEQVSVLIDVFGSYENPPSKVYCPDKPDTPQNLLDSTKARTILKWSPKYDWKKACEDIKREMSEEPFAKLWGSRIDYL